MKYFTISSSRFRVTSSRSALMIFGSRSSALVNERCQRFFGKYHAPYRYFCARDSRSIGAEEVSFDLALADAVRCI
jgi:hypothetical protein